MLTLYYTPNSCALAAHLALEMSGLEYTARRLDFAKNEQRSPEYLAINPLGTIPFMIDGETKMSESSGICYYLGTRHGPTPLIVGPDEPAYGAFLNWMYFSDATLNISRPVPTAASLATV